MKVRSDSFVPTETFLHLKDGLAETIAVTPDFWPDLAAGRHPSDGWLVTAYDIAAGPGGWDHWEMHPAGDELLYLTGGRAEITLEENGARRVEALADGQMLVIPKGAWHRAKVWGPARMLFVTFGHGTEHREG